MKKNTKEINKSSGSWSRVDSMSKKGLYQSAWDEVNVLENQAIANDDMEEQLKVLFYQLRFSSMIEEESEYKGIDILETRILNAKEPLKSILHSVVAQQYWSIYQRNRYKLYNRVDISGETLNDMSLWTARNYVDKINMHYALSIAQGAQLNNQLIKDIEPEFFIKDQKASLNYRISLYDFLMARAVSFYNHSEAGITRPANFFSVDSPQYFAPIEEFINLEISDVDKESFDYKTLILYQDMLRYYQSEGAIDLMIDTDLQRINWVASNSNLKNELSLKKTALEDLAKKHPKSKITAEVLYEKARMIQDEGNLYDPMLPEEDNRWKLKDALVLCEDVISEYPDTRGSELCLNLKSEILRAKLTLKSELVVVPEMGSLARIEYQNVEKIYCKIIDESWVYQRENIEQKDRFRQVFDKNARTEWTVDLKASEDMQSHATEIILPNLSAGYYRLLVSSDPSFEENKTIATYNKFWCTHIGVNSQIDKGEAKFNVTHTVNGEPLKDVKIEQFEIGNNRRGPEKKAELVETYKSDRNGEFSTVNFEGYHQYYLKVTWENEMIVIPHYFNGRYSENNRERFETHFFIDRGIYRPGQTIHFKAIVLKRKKYDVEIAKNYSTEIILRDANYQEVTKLKVRTNDYGTVNGTFIIPDNGLTGSMTLQESNGNKMFSVEEYKRPKFEVVMNPIQGSYKLGENIKVSGSAISFSGASLQDAEAKYTVYRKPQIKYFNWWYRCYIPPYIYNENVKIKDGVINTDNEGNFTFDFEAIDGGDSKQIWLDYYSYEVQIAVTDVNGETQTTSTKVQVGSKALVLDLLNAGQINVNESKPYGIVATNLNGEPLSTTGTLTLYALKGPQNVKIDRYWEPTDQLNYSKEELNSSMPLMAFPGQTDKSKWKREKVKEKAFDTAENKSLPDNFFNGIKDGEYLIVLKAKDEFGTAVKKEIYTQIYDPKTRSSFSNDPFEVINLKKSYLPGDQVKLLLNTSLENIKFKIEVEHKGSIIKEEFFMVTKGKKTFSMPVKSDHQGGFSIHLRGYKNNRYFAKTIGIKVPRIDKSLTVSLETFRDKMLPGSNEEWKVKVKADNNEKAMSEVLLNMYDSSLDQFVTNNRSFNPFYNHSPRLQWNNVVGQFAPAETYYIYTRSHHVRNRYYPMLNTYDYNFHGNYFGAYYGNGQPRRMLAKNAMPIIEGAESVEMDAVVVTDQAAPSFNDKEQSEFAPEEPNATSENAENKTLSPRTNFNETAFFYPDLMTDQEGNIVFKFTLPESLTSWKFQAFAHTQTLQFGLLEQEMISQKDLMVVPNLPRYFRHGDQITLSSKVVNLSDDTLDGVAGIKLFDAFTMQEITNEFITGSEEKLINLAAKGQDVVAWKLNVNEKYQAVTWRVYAKTNTHNDAEESSLPVLSNRSLVTETLPFALTNMKSLNLSFDKLKNNSSSTLKHHSLTMEYNGNPVWYAVQAMPYMMEYPHDCAEQIFTRYYANALSTHIMENRPQINKVIANWKLLSPESFLSNLEKNQELKSIVLEESPWVLESQDESERKKRVALLLDLNHMSAQQTKASQKLIESQLGSGAWPWFKGMNPNLYITQHIISGFGHLDKLGVKKMSNEETMIMRGLDYMDAEHLRRYRKMKKSGWDPKKNHTGVFQVQYLYARSFFSDQNFRSDREAFTYYSDQIKEHWTEYNTYIKGMIALILHRSGETETAQDILKSLLETSISSEQLGMYWKSDVQSWNWYEPTTEKHALLIEAFSEINNDQASVNALKTWLIMNKRTNDWKTTKATAEACYALLLQGSDWTVPTSYVITVGEEKIDSNDPELKKEAGTGYVKKVWAASEIKENMADITVKKEGESPSWGSVYWQYFEDLDKVTSAGGPMNITKNLFIVAETESGETLKPIKAQEIKIGDRIRVRLNITSDRNMEYVHIKDQRASGFEPIEVLSNYKYQGGLGYYQSTKDAGTHFFIDFLRKGTYVLDYDLFVSHAGEQSNGFALIECMYAPEFAAHSEGLRLVVKE